MFRAFLVVLAIAPFAARAVDVSAGVLEVRGDSNLGFSFSSTNVSGGATGPSTDSTAYGGDLTGLYYVAPNVGVGLALSYNASESKSIGVKSTSSNLLIGPAVAFIYPLQEKLSLSLQGDAGWARSKAKTTFSDSGIVGLVGSESSSSGFGFQLGAGVRYFLARSFSVNAGLAYVYERTTFDAPSVIPGSTLPDIKLTTSGLRVGAGLSVYFGN